MKSKETDLVEKFKKLENELLELLKIDEVEFSEDDKKQVVKNRLKAYIKKVEKARQVFEEYESVAKQIELYMPKNDVADDVVALRENPKAEEIEKYIDETIVEQGQVKVIKKKQKNNKAREF